MATENKQKHVIRESWEDIFNLLKARSALQFGTKLFTDVAFMGQDPNDTSKLIIEFNEENRV